MKAGVQPGHVLSIRGESSLSIGRPGLPYLVQYGRIYLTRNELSRSVLASVPDRIDYLAGVGEEAIGHIEVIVPRIVARDHERLFSLFFYRRERQTTFSDVSVPRRLVPANRLVQIRLPGTGTPGL